MKHIPNIFTLLNLFFGCLAILTVLQTGLDITQDTNGESLFIIPERIYLASVFIGIAAVIDFLDGFVARLFNATSLLGKQLDSLADVVSFGVAPGMIIYQFLRLSYAQQANGLDIDMMWLLPAFILPCAGAYRLARFNIDESQTDSFKGLPIPAAGLLIASFPLLYWYSDKYWIVSIVLNKWFWYAIIFLVSYLMVSRLPMLAFKFKNLSARSLLPFILIAVITIIAAVLFKWLAVPVAILAYIVVSFVYKPSVV
ncbi:MAG: CDP-diacylglycerol--glycerol-3-phosphate 3-phosphatidyltransferase [Chitinophagaceae bacterium]|nr:CDP-diacylglycerol--glycerol-3-phosphate 3-phosphatidyltransferase [Chitinophagaceae bacterium]